MRSDVHWLPDAPKQLIICEDMSTDFYWCADSKVVSQCSANQLYFDRVSHAITFEQTSVIYLYQTLRAVHKLVFVSVCRSDLSKIDPTTAVWALLRWTCSPVPNTIPSFTDTER